MKTFRHLLPLAALLLAACTPEGKAEPARPALWMFADADTTVYLFGTIHVLPKGVDWDRGQVGTAMARADRLLLEVTDPDGVDGIRRAFDRLGTSPGLPPLAERIPPEHRAKLDAMIARSGIPRATFDRMESWAAALTLGASLYQQIGVTADDGVEAALTARFAARHKPIDALETATEQFGYFDRLPEAAQRTFLDGVVAEKDEAAGQFETLVAAWSSGDVAKLAISAEDEAHLSPELADALKRQRNAVWTDRLVKALDRPGTVLVAVGATHLAGKDSLQEMLAKRGVTVKRVQ